MESLRERLGEVQNLPALPTTVIRLIRGLSGAGVCAEELQSIVQTDEAISATVLKLANSAAQGQTGRAFTLHESIARLGSRVMQRIAISHQCYAALGGGGEGFGLERGQLWVSALGGALAAEMLARQSKVADPGVCFVSGLLRDIGKLAMDQLLGVEELQNAFACVPAGSSQIAVEREHFATDHAEIGAELAALWGLPEGIRAAIRYHHEPDLCEGEDRAVSDVVHCADAVATWMGLAQAGFLDPISEAAMQTVGLSRETAQDTMTAVKSELAQMTGDQAGQAG